MNIVLGCLGPCLLATAVVEVPAFGAEQISFVNGALEFSLPIEDLELYAKQGKITDKFAFYAKRINPQQRALLRDILLKRLEVNSTNVAQFTYSPIGVKFLELLGQVLQTQSGQNGFYALRAACILAAGDAQGLTILNMLRKFPNDSIRIDVNRSFRMTTEMAQLLKQREAIIGKILQQTNAEATFASQIDFSSKPDLSLLGAFTWQKETLTLNDRNRNRVFPADIYLPQTQSKGRTKQSAPVIVISHGLASDRNTFAYLAQHLASHGFAVAVLEHADNAQRFQQFFAGFDKLPQPTEFINRPLDVTYLLDELQRRSQSEPAWQGRLNLTHVGVIGQSMGGYTALAVAGAELNFEQLRADCGQLKPNDIFLNLSLLVQCRATELPSLTYKLQDKRVKAVIAINPVSSIFGSRGLSEIQVPVMLVASQGDIFAPAVPEQILPFTQLTNLHKYLVLVEKGTHFSMLSQSVTNSGLPVLPPELNGLEPALAKRYLKVLSVVFAKTYVANQPEYQSYLSASYAKAITQAPLNLSLVQLLTTTQLAPALNASHLKP
ncbi:alpha/beta hydrolase [Scytonema sp. PRP1]|uniref:alpha/beta hydrolase n=1 Tax=Scytonema sp. PRP1 TaxID=3120513 RepID=UPI002FD66627